MYSLSGPEGKKTAGYPMAPFWEFNQKDNADFPFAYFT